MLLETELAFAPVLGFQLDLKPVRWLGVVLEMVLGLEIELELRIALALVLALVLLFGAGLRTVLEPVRGAALQLNRSENNTNQLEIENRSRREPSKGGREIRDLEIVRIKGRRFSLELGRALAPVIGNALALETVRGLEHVRGLALQLNRIE